MSKQGVYQVQCLRCHVIAYKGPDLSAGKRVVWRLCEPCEAKIKAAEVASEQGGLHNPEQVYVNAVAGESTG